MGTGPELILQTIERDVPVLAIGLPYMRRFIRPSRITFIASARCLAVIQASGLVSGDSRLLDEDDVAPGLSLGLVQDLLERRGANRGRAGWYLKQMLNLAYATRDDAGRHYLTWDSDSIPLRPIEFFDGRGRILYVRKSEHHRAYFTTLRRLLGIGRLARFSFIAEHMMFDREVSRDLLAAIMKGEPFEGAALAARIIGAVADEDLSKSGFAEYETYGTWALATRPETIAIRKMRSSRRGTAFFGRSPAAAELFTLSTRYQWVTFEAWPVTGLRSRLRQRALRRIGRSWVRFAVRTRPSAFAEFRRIAATEPVTPA
jgi:hypothetical protein